MLFKEYENLLKQVGGEDELRSLLVELSQSDLEFFKTTSVTSIPMEELLVPSRSRLDFNSGLTDLDGLYIKVRRIKKRERLYEVSFGECYGECGKGWVRYYKKSTGRWIFQKCDIAVLF